MQYARAFKFNSFHDEQGRFAESGGGTDFGANGSEGGSPGASFDKAANALYKAQGVKDWEKASPLANGGPKTYFGTGRAFEINKYLRNGPEKGKIDSTLPDWVARVHESFGPFGVNIESGTELYRAVGEDFGKVLDGMKKGDTFVDKGFVSTATRPMTTAFGTHVMQITTKGGHRVMLHKGENEVLFEPGRKFTYKGKSKGKGEDKNLTFYNVELE